MCRWSPVLKRPFSNAVGYSLFAIVPIVGWIIAGLLPDTANIADWELDAIIVDLVLLILVAHGLLLVVSRTPQAGRLQGHLGRVHGRRGRHVRDDDASPTRSSRTSGSPSPTSTCSGTPPSSCSAAARTCSLPVNWPFNINKKAIRDIIVTGIYVVLFGLNLFLFAMWQKRGAEKAETADATPQDARASAVRCGAEARRSRSTAAATARTVVTPDGPHRRQPADARLRHRLRAAGGRPVVPHRVGEAEAVPPHRPGRVHPLRGLRRHLPVEVHPHGLGRARSSDAVNTEQPGEDPRDHVAFIVDEDVCTRCALCVDRCPTGVIILGKLATRQSPRATPTPAPTAHGYAYGVRF